MSVCTPKSFDLTGKVALITGASYGIGFAIATAMANNGATIVFNDIKQELVDKGLAAYKEAGIDATSPTRTLSRHSSSRLPRKLVTSTFWSTTPVSSSVSR
mgnify:FL=1